MLHQQLEHAAGAWAITCFPNPILNVMYAGIGNPKAVYWLALRNPGRFKSRLLCFLLTPRRRYIYINEVFRQHSDSSF
jgi:hypothetical protein